ncbi:MAG: hypothetical protein L0Z50_21535 [Verrucomicrobiales bacterium]|nr:hypothetical protein [Verrucomicrobiales bacterium]
MIPNLIFWFTVFVSSYAVGILAANHISLETGNEFFPVWENESFAGFSIVRSATDWNTTCRVDYFTADGTAKAGMDYTATHGTLVFLAGEWLKEITVPLAEDNSVLEGDRTFQIYLTNPINATVEAGGVEHPQKVVIQDDEYSASNPDLTFRPSLNGNVHAVQSDGRILISGNNCSPVGLGCSWLMRLNQDGSWDPSYLPKFERDGSDTPGLHGSVWQLRLASDDSAVMRGDFSRVNGINRAGIVRLLPDGSVDERFVPPINIPALGVRLLIVLKDGRVLLQHGSDASLKMLLANGADDLTFRIPDFLSGIHLNTVVEVADGKLLVVSDGIETKAVVRLTRDGSLDPSFRSQFELPKPAAFVWVRDAQVQADNKILVLGSFDAADAPVGFLVRLNPDGSRDPSFSNAPELAGRSGGIGLQSDGRILVETDLWGPRRIRRLTADGALDSSFAPVVCAGSNGDGFPRPSRFYLHGSIAIVAMEVHSLNGVPVGSLARLRLDQFPRSAVIITSTDLAHEGVSEAQVVVRRLGDLLSSARVSFVTRDNTAKAGRDYVAKVGTVEFGPLEAEKKVRIAILDNNVLESPRTFEVVLSDVLGFEAVGPPASLTIYDDEVGFVPGSVQLSLDSITGQQQALIRWNTAPTGDYRLEASSDLKSWSEVKGTPFSHGLFWQQVDSDAGAFARRFYRAREIRR